MPKSPVVPRNISILGCGWLGMPLLQSLVSAGHHVRGSARKPEVLAQIEAAGGQAFRIDLPQELPAEFMHACDLLIITLPPRGRALGEATARHYLDCFIPLAGWLNGPRSPAVIFTSSTSVYGDVEGVVTEATPLQPNSHSARAVVEAEEWLAATRCRLTILRLAGLVSADRHPGNFYGGKDRPVPASDAPVNIVHRDDVIAAIGTILSQNATGLYNVCAAAHPPKGAFYLAAASALGLEIAGTVAGGQNGKRIDSSRLRASGWMPAWDSLELDYLR